MAHAVIMPRQGNTVESCVIVRWKAAEGDAVPADAALCEVETDKATFDVAAGQAGVLLKILRPEGDDVPVLEPIAVVGAAGEDWRAALPAGAAATSGAAPAGGAQAAPAAPATAMAAAPAAAGLAAPVTASATAPAAGVSPRARRLAAGEGLDPVALAGTGPGGRVIERDVVAAAASRPGLTAAARAAAASGAAVPAAGRALGGRAGVADLGAPGAFAQAATAAPSVRREYPGPVSEAPVKGIRKLIAERMRASLAAHAQLTLHSSAPADRLLDLRARFKASEPELGLSGVTLGDLVLYAVARTLPRFPFMNAHMTGESVRSFERVHLGLAVDTPRGLMVPVIRCADLLSLRELSAEAKRLASACSGGTVAPDELGGSTFTVTNLGAFGIESFTPVLNSPEVGILGVCSVAQRPAPGPGPSFESRMGLSLTIDHQVVDGAPAARFLQALSAALADIDLLLVK